MSTASTSMRKEERGEIDVYKVTAIPLARAIKLAFSVPPTIGTLVLGPPGIGKTETVRKFAELEAQKLNKEFIDLNEKKATLTEEDYNTLLRDIYKNPEKYYVFVMVPFGRVLPEDLLGYPTLVHIKDGDKTLMVVEESAMKAPLAILTVPGVHGVLLIDDALNINDNVRKSFLLAVFNERVVGGFGGAKLSSNVRVIGTGNLTAHSELATAVPSPMTGRAQIVLVKEEDLKSWYHYMQTKHGDNWFKEVYAFLGRYENYYSRYDLKEETTSRAPVPRSWEKLAVALHAIRDEVKELLSKGPEEFQILTGIVASHVGYEAAAQFVAFISKPYISVDEVVANPKRLDEVVKDMDVVYRFSVELGSKISKAIEEGDKAKVITYLGVLKDLMEKTTEDIGVFVYETLSKENRSKLKKMVMTEAVSKDTRTREIAVKIRNLIASITVADTLIGRG